MTRNDDAPRRLARGVVFLHGGVHGSGGFDCRSGAAVGLEKVDHREFGH